MRQIGKLRPSGNFTKDTPEGEGVKTQVQMVRLGVQLPPVTLWCGVTPMWPSADQHRGGEGAWWSYSLGVGRCKCFFQLLSLHLHFTCCIYSPDPPSSNRALAHKSHTVTPMQGEVCGSAWERRTPAQTGGVSMHGLIGSWVSSVHIKF